MSEGLPYRHSLKVIRRSIHLVHHCISVLVVFLKTQIMKVSNINIHHENIKCNNIMHFFNLLKFRIICKFIKQHF